MPTPKRNKVAQAQERVIKDTLSISRLRMYKELFDEFLQNFLGEKRFKKLETRVIKFDRVISYQFYHLPKSKKK